jgi:excisionase family DNA binding protein
MSTTLQLNGRDMVTCQEAARLYGCTMSYIRRLARDGRITSLTLGRTWLVDKSEVSELRRASGHMAKGFGAN